MGVVAVGEGVGWDDNAEGVKEGTGDGDTVDKDAVACCGGVVSHLSCMP